MKTTTATIRLILRTSKVLSDGSNPIYLRCNWNGMKEVSTGYSCTIKYWDKKNEMIKKGYPNYATINAILIKLKNDAIDRRNKFELDGIAYTPSMVLSKGDVIVIPVDNFEGLKDRYIESLSPTTQRAWKSFYNSFTGYKKVDSINEITLDVIKGYAKHLEDSGMKDSTIKMTLAKLSALCKFAVEEGILKSSPFKRFNFHKKYKLSSNILHIDKQAIDVLKSMLLERLIIMNDDGSTYKYIDDGLNDVLDRRSDLFVLFFYLFGYVSFGLAPIDLCQLKVKDMKVIEENGVNYYVWDGKRQKTGVGVKLMINQNRFFDNLLYRTMLMFRQGEYILPILDGVENDRLKIYKKVSNWLSNHSDVLRDWFKVANDRIIKLNVENNSSIPLIDLGCTFYSYRSSFAMAFMQSGGNLLQVCSLLGRGVNASLASYVRQLTKNQDIAASIGLMAD